MKIEHGYKGCERVEKASRPEALGFAVLTVSTSRYYGKTASPKDDSGDIIVSLLRAKGHRVVRRGLVPDRPRMIRGFVLKALQRKDVDGVIITGGTGLTANDLTIETVRPLLDREIPGFGELFRKISYDEIGAHAALSRATAGVRGGKVIFCLPGSPNAVETAMKYLVLDIAPSAVVLARQ